MFRTTTNTSWQTDADGSGWDLPPTPGFANRSLPEESPWRVSIVGLLDFESSALPTELTNQGVFWFLAHTHGERERETLVYLAADTRSRGRSPKRMRWLRGPRAEVRSCAQATREPSETHINIELHVNPVVTVVHHPKIRLSRSLSRW